MMSDITVMKEMLAAGPGCAVANGLLNAFETTKVKLQLHNSAHKVSSSAGTTTAAIASRPVVYHNATMMGVMTQIAREEGIVRGLLTPGLSASITRSLLYGAYRVGLYPTVRDTVGRYSNNKQTDHYSLIRQRILSGMVTGGLGSMVSCPLDVVRTRMQADAGLIAGTHYATGLRQGQPVRYTGMVSAITTIWREEGLFQGLYRGASVTIARACCLNGAQLASYDTMKQYALARGKDEHDNSVLFREGPQLHVVCAFWSGVLAQTVIMPIDTLKSHMMLGKGWKDVFQHVGKVVTEEGPFHLVKWLYRGYAPACAGQGLIMVLQMPLIEAFRRGLGVGAI